MTADAEIIMAKPYATNEWARLLIRPSNLRIELYRCAYLEYTQRCANRREANLVVQDWLNKRKIAGRYE
jgi:hypothetical protein